MTPKERKYIARIAACEARLNAAPVGTAIKDALDDNASLISAAPDLLTACKGIMDVHDAHGHVEADNGWWDTIRAAIHKAEVSPCS